MVLRHPSFVILTLLLHFSGGCCNISLVKMRQKTNRSPSFLKCMIPLLMLAVLFFGCGVLPPVISSITVSPSNRVIAESPVSISAEATSGSGLALTYTWSANGGSLSSNTGKSIVWRAPSAPGVYIVTLTVSDGTNSVSDTINMVVVDPNAPIIDSIVIDPNPAAVNKEVTLTCSATDPGGETLQYVWSSPTGGTLLSTIGNTVKWRAPSTAGIYRITTTVTNTSRLSVSADSNIQVVVPIKPVVDLSASAGTVAVNGTIDFTAIVSDEYGFPITAYQWYSSGGSRSVTDNSMTWTAPSTAGNYYITVKAYNGSVWSDTVRADVIVTE